MNLPLHCLFVALCCSGFALSVSDDSDFIDEKGKALKNLKVVPGSKRDKMEFHTVEQEAGRAVLKLLDAKIGKKVNDAAKEVTDFLNDAVGHHAKQRTARIRSDKEKEMSLLHLGAKKVLSNNDEEDKPKKNKDGSFLVHFKIPYIVTPVDKKKPKAKKFHHKKIKKPHHLKKYHHRVLHHKHHHHHHHHAHTLDANRPAAPAGVPQTAYNPQAPAKTFHHKHVKKHHRLRKYHHLVLHEKHHHHRHYHHHVHALDGNTVSADGNISADGNTVSPDANMSADANISADANMSVGVPQVTHDPQAPAAQPQAQPPNYNAIDLTFNGYNWTYNYSNDTSSDMIPCQGNCMDPCTQDCSISQDCCCCDPNMMAQSQMVPAQAYPPIAPPPMYQPPAVAPAVPASMCPTACKRNCFTYCPRACCGVAGKRDEVVKNVGSGNEETPVQAESDQKDNASAEESVEQSEEENNDTTKPTEDNEKVEEQTTNDVSQEGSSESNDKVDNNVEIDD